jgi:hypothetical protein
MKHKYLSGLLLCFAILEVEKVKGGGCTLPRKTERHQQKMENTSVNKATNKRKRRYYCTECIHTHFYMDRERLELHQIAKQETSTSICSTCKQTFSSISEYHEHKWERNCSRTRVTLYISYILIMQVLAEATNNNSQEDEQIISENYSLEEHESSVEPIEGISQLYMQPAP